MRTRYLNSKNTTLRVLAVATPLFFIPLFAFAAKLVPCEINCGFKEFMQLIQNVINFLMFDIASPLAAIAFAWAGIIMLTAGGSTEKIKQAKEVFWWVFIGFVVALSGWLVVSTLMGALLGGETASFVKTNFLNF